MAMLTRQELHDLLDRLPGDIEQRGESYEVYVLVRLNAESKREEASAHTPREDIGTFIAQ